MENKIFDTETKILHNGLKVITIKRNTQITSIHIGINVGSVIEKARNRGVSHFIEHMLYKGTKNRNNEELNDALEKRGGEYNAYTDYTCTVYGITALSEELEPSLEILSDMIINSTFPEEEIEKERGVILAEIRTSRDDIEDYSFNKINEIAFNKSALRYDILGEEKTVKRLNRQQLVEFYNRYYVPNNCNITIVSPYEHEEVLELVNKYFSLWQYGKLEKEKIITEDNIEIKKTTYKENIEQSTIIYAFTFHGFSKLEELALKILNHKFGESANSILFRELREEKGLAYDVYSQLDMTSHVKTLYIYTAVGADSIEEALSTIDSCIAKIKNREIDFNEETVNLMKKVLKTAVAATLEDSTDLGNYVLHQSLEEESIYEFVEDMKNLEIIKMQHIYDVANKVFSKPAIHILTSRSS
ncbi:insulinase family protein [Clostridium sp. YIM B02515]|uniref:Insulinase family protein n=1 Tax=Clostridium rhizosphaerae TaxID=2803861 RepID=A0ABS1T7G5_9CLOT|nr:pitrilysin family protein [Clostridium rhizosphaerae]MBL4935279.1 insulinase family protein [Clostridium rhizosphaerae]